MDDFIELTVDIKADRHKAILVTDGTVEAWLPKSLVKNRRLLPGYFEYEIEIPEWLALDKGFI